MSSNVSHPAHYNSGKIEVIEFIEDQGFGPEFCRGNAIKYAARAGKKDPTKTIEDLEKAVWYLNREIEMLKAEKENREPKRPNDMNPRELDLVRPQHIDEETFQKMVKSDAVLHGYEAKPLYDPAQNWEVKELKE